MNGAWMVSETRFGPLVHARLGVAEDNSGKLVTLVRNEARRVARRARPASGHRRRLAGHRLPGHLLARRRRPRARGHRTDRLGASRPGSRAAGGAAVPAAVRRLREQGGPEPGARASRSPRRRRPPARPSSPRVAYDPAVTRRPGGRHRRHRLRRSRRDRDHRGMGGRRRRTARGHGGARPPSSHARARGGGRRDRAHAAARVRTGPVAAARPLARRRPRAVQDLHLRLRLLPARAHDAQDGDARALGRPGRRGRAGARPARVTARTSSLSRDRANRRCTPGSAR